MPRSSGDMPFLDHLEELRSRILRSLLAVVACFALGLFLVDRLHLIDVLKRPIAQFLPSGQLTVLSPTEPLMITLKLGFITGLVLASPVVLWQLWAFLSPALYEKEKKTLVPALFVGLGLFLGGAVLSFVFIVPQALRVLLTFQQGSFNTMITFDAYFSFVMQLVLALGLSCELPLLMIILAALGIVATPLLNRIRPYAVVGSFILGAILSPGADVLSMFMLTIPLLFLYEIGVAGVWLVQRRRRKAEVANAIGGGAAVLVLLCLAAPPRQAAAQQPPPQRPAPGRLPPGLTPARDTARPAGRRLDSASARRLGLPSAPKRSFEAADSILAQLMNLEGYEMTRFSADSATVLTTERVVDLRGNAMTDRAGSVLEASSIKYREGDCAVEAKGEPHLFQGGQVMIGSVARFDTCRERGVLRDALTNFQQQGGNWFIRGNLAVDSANKRLYGGHAELTSCDLPIPHYQFKAREIKWVSQSVMVARPAVLYIRDVPIAWIPFMFQDTKQGRRSGILIPQFGFNDIVRNSASYNRQVTNMGYYWALNEYFDAQVQLDWFSKRYVAYGVTAQYNVRSRFINGSASYQVLNESGGHTSRSVDWVHNQQFNNSTRLNLNLHYTTSSAIVARNSIDPLVTTRQIQSQGKFTKQFSWGSVDLGLTRRQNISDGSGDMTLPSLTFTPKPIDFGRVVTWSPGVSFTNQLNFKTPLSSLIVPGIGGGVDVDTIPQTGSTRLSTFSLQTPVRIGSFNWPISIRVVDSDSTGRYSSQFKAPNLDTPEPDDSIFVTQIRKGGFNTSFDWDTQIGLPILFRSTWKFTPSVGITNSKPGQPFAVRNALTGGSFVHQGKRLQLSASISPTFFGFFGGIGGIDKIRHSISPIISYAYSPAASVPEDFARAIAAPGRLLELTSPASQSVSLTLSQNFEAKGKPSPGDTTGQSARKFRLLGINTSSISYDFEQAKQPGRTGWTTSAITNTLASDLLPGFTFSASHDLWDGPVGMKGSKFSPFLSSVSSNFSLSARTFQGIGALFGLAKKPANRLQDSRAVQPGTGGVLPAGDTRRNMLLTPSQTLSRGARPFTANLTLNISRSRAGVDALGASRAGTSQSNIGLNASFSPTQFWSVTWATHYNSTLNKFESQQIQLARDLHEWRAAFNFQKAANGNFAFFFSVFLTDFPDINYKYNQTTIKREQ